MTLRIPRVLRLPSVLLLALALASCGDDGQSLPPSPARAGLDPVVVGAGDSAGSRAWAGVVEAVRHAALAAQPSGRVAEVRRDVGDRVAEGELLVRLTAVEQ